LSDKKYAGIWKRQLLTRDGKLIVATAAEWYLFEGNGFDLVEVTVEVTGQVALKACLELEHATPYPKLMIFQGGELNGENLRLDENKQIPLQHRHYRADAGITEIYRLDRYTDSDYFYEIDEVIYDEK